MAFRVKDSDYILAKSDQAVVLFAARSQLKAGNEWQDRAYPMLHERLNYYISRWTARRFLSYVSDCPDSHVAVNNVCRSHSSTLHSGHYHHHHPPVSIPAAMLVPPTPVEAHEDIHSSPEPEPSKKISAYYSLVFPHFTFYIQTLSITIGRRTNPNGASSSSDQSHIDVDLGSLKSVSRLHAKIEYDPDQDRFVLAVISRNGAWVDGVWQGSGTRAPLGERYVHSASYA